jgi:hypothetical protein
VNEIYSGFSFQIFDLSRIFGLMAGDNFRLIKKSFFISLLYVGLGTISLVINPHTASETISDLGTILVFITLPVNFISVGIMYADSNAIGTVLLVQSVVFVLFWFIVYLILKMRLRKQKTNIQHITIGERKVD